MVRSSPVLVIFQLTNLTSEHWLWYSPLTHFSASLHLLDACYTIIPNEVPQQDVETPDHDGEDSDGLEEELGAEDDPQDNDNEANEIALEVRKFQMQKQMLWLWEDGLLRKKSKTSA